MRVPAPEAPAMLVRLTTAEGAVGHGEVAAAQPPAEAAAALEELAPLVVGRDPRERGAVWERLAWAVEWPGGADPLAAAILSALDLSLWALAGQATGLPIHMLLGGRYLRQVDTYRYYAAESEGATPPAGGVLVAAEQEPEQAVATVESLRRRWGDAVPLWVDFRAALSEPEPALTLGRRLQAAEAFCWLDPFPARFVREYQVLAREVEVPLGAGSELTGLRGYRKLLEGNCLDLLAVDVRRAGGLTGALRIAHLAGAYQLPVALRAGHWSATLLAAAHLACTSGIYLPVARGAESDGTESSLPVVDGFLSLPEKPGLGEELREQFLERYQVCGGA